MKQHSFGKYIAEIDEEATKSWYAKADKWDCTCGDCRNFLALAKKRELSKTLLNILDSLGIPPEKATYVCMLYSGKSGFCYQLSYRVAGKILNKEEGVKTFEGNDSVACSHDNYPNGSPDFPEPNFDLMFMPTLPWVIDEDPNY